MWAVSPAFLAAVLVPHRVDTRVTATVPGGSPVTLDFVSGSIQCDNSQLIRRQAQSLTVNGGSTVYDLVSTPGCQIKVHHGVEWSYQDPELVPVITGELSKAAQTLGDGTVVFDVADLWQKVAAENFHPYFTPSTSTGRVAQISASITAAIPGVTVTNASTDTGTVFSKQTWSSRSDMIAQLATDGGTEVFFGPDGNFRIRNEALPTDSAVWSIRPDLGNGGNMISLQRQVPLDKLINTVIVAPSATDGSQTWTAQTKTITDSSHPRYPGKIGTRTLLHESGTISSASDALFAAGVLLSRELGSTETFQVGALSNPALEAGDVISITNIVDTGYSTVQHMVTSFTLDLVSGDMTVTTRSDAEAVS